LFVMNWNHLRYQRTREERERWGGAKGAAKEEGKKKTVEQGSFPPDKKFRGGKRENDLNNREGREPWGRCSFFARQG